MHARGKLHEPRARLTLLLDATRRADDPFDEPPVGRPHHQTCGVCVQPSCALQVDQPARFALLQADALVRLLLRVLAGEQVDGEEGSFEIEAQSYGARGPITCTITEGAFDCEQQEVVPLAFDIGEYGWEYAIDYSGEVVDEQTIRGVAVVSYPGIDETTAYWLDRYGISASDCTQTLELELSWVD